MSEDDMRLLITEAEVYCAVELDCIILRSVSIRIIKELRLIFILFDIYYLNQYSFLYQSWYLEASVSLLCSLCLGCIAASVSCVVLVST